MKMIQMPAITLALFFPVAVAQAQSEPSFSVRQATLRSVVHVESFQCPGANGHEKRSGSGFILAGSGQIVTAHHVVGGCGQIMVSHDSNQISLYNATVVRVLAKGDLALLQPNQTLSLPGLNLAAPPPDKNHKVAAAGYQNGQPSADDLVVGFSPSDTHLQRILTASALRELQTVDSPIAFDRQVLRFNYALQPGMSGGPIVDVAGKVVGIVAGGLKAGAAPASWGWPSEWINELLASADPPNWPIHTEAVYYSLQDMQEIVQSRGSRAAITCGALSLAYHGRKRFTEISTGADDQARLRHIVNISTQPFADIAPLEFDLWVNEQTGATAVVPAGIQIVKEADVCVAKSPREPIEIVIWGGEARNAMEIQAVSQRFESVVMFQRVPYTFGFNIDPQLTTVMANGMPGPQFRDDMVFNRKGFSQPKQPFFGPGTPMAHSFETLVAKSGAFLGVGTINDDLPSTLPMCLQLQGNQATCGPTIAHLHEWTRFILATQLSTFPTY